MGKRREETFHQRGYIDVKWALKKKDVQHHYPSGKCQNELSEQLN